MKLQIVPAGRGAQWVRQGFAVFFSRPLAFMGLFGLWLLGTLVAQLLPWIGFLLVWGTLPLVTLGFMLATQQALQGRFPTLKVFVLPLRSGCGASRNDELQLAPDLHHQPRQARAHSGAKALRPRALSPAGKLAARKNRAQRARRAARHP